MRKVLIYVMILVFVAPMLFMGIGCKTTAVETTAAETTAAEITSAEKSAERVSIELDFTPANKLVPTAKFEPIAQKVEINVGLNGVWDMMLPHAAKDLGFFDDVNINVKKFYDFAKEVVELEALQGGSIDICGSAEVISVPLAKTLDNVTWLGSFDMWWRYAVMARPGVFKTYAEILEEVGDETEAARLVCSQLKGKTLDTQLGNQDTFIQGVLDLGGMTWEDIKINDMPAVEAAAAFIRGEGDFYIGDLPGRYRVAEDGAIPILDASIFGQEGWCFVGFLANKDWLENNNEDTAIRYIGTLYRVADVLGGPDQDIPLEIMRQNVNRMSGASFTLENGRVINSQVSPWFTVEQARDILYNPDSKFSWKARLKYLIDGYISQGKLNEGDVTIDSHSRADELFEKYWNYKIQSEEDMKLVAEAYNSGTAKNSDEVRNLIEQAKWNWDIRNYIDAAKLAADAKSSAGI